VLLGFGGRLLGSQDLAYADRHLLADDQDLLHTGQARLEGVQLLDHGGLVLHNEILVVQNVF